MSSENLNLNTTRLRQWWRPKASNLLAILYVVMLITALPFSKALLLFLPSVITILGIGSFGHIINDWCDIGPDRRAGKNNRMAMLSPWQRTGLLLLSLLVALVPWWWLPWDRFTIVLLACEFGLLLMYALPPVRLKERIMWSLPADSAYAYAIPAVMAAYTFFLASEKAPDIYFLSILFFWQFALGIRHYLNHLAADRLNDIASNTHTLATQKNNAFIHKLIKNFVLPAETAGFIGLLIFTGFYQPMVPVLAVVLFLAYSFLPLILAVGRNYSLFSFRFSNTELDRFYQGRWPFVSLAMLIISNWYFVVLLAGHLLLFSRPLQSIVRNIGLFTARYIVYRPVAFLLIYPVVLLKKRTAVKSQSAGREEKPVKNEQLLRKEAPKIAIANINKQKYTETFINEILPRLKYNVCYLYGGELPVYDHEDRPFLSFKKVLHRLAFYHEKLLRLDQGYYLKQSISNYLQSRNVRLVLAEFGPVGTALSPITADLGIPLVVYFHGYDVFSKETLRIYLEKYRSMFVDAKKIIGVSEYMLARLRELGAPPEKLVHLPAYVNLGLFPYGDHSRLPPRFLAVGRFAETKSPHLTLLAFEQVVQQIPEATLTMIGKGGGGELFESCLILVKALRLEKNVVFKGVQTHEEVAHEMQQARVFVQHSVITPEQNDCEGKPVAIMEAMSCGLPVVATNHPGINELIEDKISGLLVDEYDINAMAAAMLLLAKDDELNRTLGLKASTKIQQDTLISRHIEKLESIIDDCIEE